MGSADIIPGVSGGTIALIAGIYHALLQAIQSFNATTIQHLIKFEWKQALATLHLRFLLVLFSGIGLAIITIARVMNFLLQSYPVFTWSLFFGLIGASILILGRNIRSWFGKDGIAFAFGAVFAWFLVGMIPVSTPESWWFIILAGMIAICAMILPGISGAFILLILGKYEFVTYALKHPFSPESLLIIALFCVGCLIGITSFSRILSWLLSRYEAITLSILTGLMFGSMRKIWPWKEVLETKIIRNKVHVLREQNIFPEQLDLNFLIACFLIIFGFSFILFLEKKANKG